MDKQQSSAILFSNAQLVDGTGAPSFKAFVLVEDGHIAAISSSPLDANCAEQIDCEGLHLAPGFIDAHSHMDYYAATQDLRYFESFTQQGITSFVGGNCGFSPCTVHTDSAHNHLLENTLFEVPNGRDVLCNNINTFDEKVASSAIRHNFYEMVGHGSYRTSISGFDSRALTQTERTTLLDSLEDALKKGALGVSLGLQYKPGVFVSRDEIIDVARLVSRYDRVMAVHAKAYSCISGTYPPIPFGTAHNLRAIKELLSVAKETGVRLQFSHLIFAGRNTWKTADKALALFDEARAQGVDVCFDMFPYNCGATLLNTMLPEWFMDSMPNSAHSKWARLRLRVEMAVGLRLAGFGYDDIQLSYAACDKYDGCEGLTMTEIARKYEQKPLDSLVELLALSNSQARVLNHSYYGPGIVERLMAHDAALFSTDAWPELHGIQNPAAYGSFPRFLEITRTQNNISLEECIRKMTSATAERFQLKGRGVIAENAKADLVLFKYNDVADKTQQGANDATPEGIVAVYANGQALQRA